MDLSSLCADAPSVFNPPEYQSAKSLWVDSKADSYMAEPEALLAEFPDKGHRILMLLSRADTSVKLFAAQAELNDALREMAGYLAERDWKR